MPLAFDNIKQTPLPSLKQTLGKFYVMRKRLPLIPQRAERLYERTVTSI